jgi:NADH-quinone oxidoreductase subunit H
MATVSALATTLFLGGWHAPWPIIQVWEGADSGYWPLLWFFGKMLLFIFMFIWLRGSLPRLRYDQFMAFGWKRLIPISLVWIIAVATIRIVTLDGGIDRSYLLAAAGVFLVLFLVLFFVGDSGDEDEVATADADAEVDAFAGGFPTPPMPTGGAVRGAALPLTFAERRTTVTGTADDSTPASDEER